LFVVVGGVVVVVDVLVVGIVFSLFFFVIGDGVIG